MYIYVYIYISIQDLRPSTNIDIEMFVLVQSRMSLVMNASLSLCSDRATCSMSGSYSNRCVVGPNSVRGERCIPQ